jgi:hypothetical protein
MEWFDSMYLNLMATTAHLDEMKTNLLLSPI